MKRTFAFALTIFLCLGFLFGFGSKEELPTAIDPANPSPQDEDFLFSQRIVSLIPSVTETLFAIDAQDMIVARTDFCTWPPEVAAIPSVGGFDGKTISLERILSFKPDLVCLAEVMHNHLIQPLEDLGIEVFVSNAESVQHIQDEILMLGSFTGKMDDTMLLLDTISWQLEQARIQATEKATAESPDTVYWEVASAPYFTPGKDSFITDLLAVIGLENIFAQVPQAYPQVSEESIIAGQPQVIFFPDYNHQGQQAVQTIARRAGWQTLPAVANGKIFPVDSDLFSRPGPRIGEMALQLVDLIYGLPPQLEGAP